MNRFTFFLNIEGSGDNTKEAWEDALEKLLTGITKGEYDKPPDTIYGPDDPISGGDVLDGPPYMEFAINHGPEDT